MVEIVFPSDPTIRNLLGSNLSKDRRKAARAFRARVDRAVETGILPAKIYVSKRRFGFDRRELEQKLAALPRTDRAFERTTVATLITTATATATESATAATR